MQLGFSINHNKPGRLSQLYHVKCYNNDVVYADGEVKKQMDSAREKSSQLKKSQSSQSNKSDLSESSSSSSLSSSYLARGSDRRPPKVNGAIEVDDKIEVLCLQFNQNLNLIATGDSDGRLQVYDVFSGSPVTSIKDAKPSESMTTPSKCPLSATHNMPIICMKWHPETHTTSNFLYYAHVNGYIGVLERETMKKQIIIEENDEIACIDFNIDGTCMASVGKDFCIRLYDSNVASPAFNKMIKSYGMHNLDIHNQELIEQSPSTNLYHTSRLQCAKFSNMSNEVLFTGGWDRTVKIWDKRTQHGLVNTINGPFICGSDAIDVCNYLVLTASWVKQNALHLWDIRNCSRKLAQLPVHTELNDSSQYSTYNTIIPDADSVDSNARKKGEYLYACKFFASNNQHQAFSVKDSLRSTRIKLTNPDSYSTVLACGSGTQAVHLIDYEEPDETKHITAIKCHAPLYCLDTMYSCSLIACGSMKRFLTIMTTEKRPMSSNSVSSRSSNSSSSSN